MVVFDAEKKPLGTVIFLGYLSLLTVTSTAILYANEKEFILDRFDISSFELSLYDTTLYVAYFIAGIIIAILSDKFAKRKLFVIIGSIGSSILFTVMTVTKNYPVLLLLRFIQGCFSIMVWQLLVTIVLDVSDSQTRGRNMGIYGVLLAIGMGLGPMIGGFLAERGVFVPYYMATGLMLSVLMLSFLLKEPLTIKQRSTVKESLMILEEHPKLIIPCIFNFIDRLHMGFLLFALPLLIGLDEGLGLDTKYRGIAFGIFALPFILFQYPFGVLSDKIGRYSLLIAGSCCYGIILSIMGYHSTKSFGILLVFLVLLGFFSSVTAPTSMALVGDNIHSQKKHGAGMGVFTLFGNIGITIGPPIAGIALSYGFGIAFLIAGLIELGSLGINVLILRVKFKERFSIS